jgi:dipeptide/tripeptide permease
MGKKSYIIVPPSGIFLPWQLFKLFIRLNILKNVQKYQSISSDNPEPNSNTSLISFDVEEDENQDIIDLSDISSLTFLLVPAPFFWMTFGQTGTTLQDMAERMSFNPNSPFFNPQTLNAALNPLLILLLTPIFTQLIYPRLGNGFTMTKRMAVGILFVSLGFGLGAILSLFIESSCTSTNSLTEPPLCKSETVHIAWQTLIYLFLTAGEILYSVSGLNLAYTEVSPRLKYAFQSYILNIFM